MGKLICRNLRARRGAFSLEVESLTIAGGEKIALLGENGCGKTTLLQVLAGLPPLAPLPPGGGEIFYREQRWDRLSPRARSAHLAYLPQETELLFNLSVGELLELTLHRGRLLRGAARQRVLEALELENFTGRPYAALSGGEKRRAMLARVFCRQADFILLDEPTAALDLRHAAQFMGYAAGVGAAIVAAIHDLNLALRYFDRFLLIRQGRILFDKRKEELESAQLEEVFGLRLVRCGDYFLPDA